VKKTDQIHKSVPNYGAHACGGIHGIGRYDWNCTDTWKGVTCLGCLEHKPKRGVGAKAK
jgi:hypothetical protein